MPVTIELIVLMLLCYALGISIGWALWGSASPELPQSDDTKEEK